MRLAVNVASDAETRRAPPGCPRSARISCCGFVLENYNCYAIDRLDRDPVRESPMRGSVDVRTRDVACALRSIVMPSAADLFLKVLPFQEFGNLEKQKSPMMRPFCERVRDAGLHEVMFRSRKAGAGILFPICNFPC